jgi:hypothetical protein
VRRSAAPLSEWRSSTDTARRMGHGCAAGVVHEVWPGESPVDSEQTNHHAAVVTGSFPQWVTCRDRWLSLGLMSSATTNTLASCVEAATDRFRHGREGSWLSAFSRFDDTGAWRGF